MVHYYIFLFYHHLIRDIGIEIVGELIERTPVDLGNARAHWWVELGGDAPSDVAESVEDAASKQQEGIQELTNYELNDGKIEIYNNVPYILALENGHSDQAPGGFMNESIENGIRSVGQ